MLLVAVVALVVGFLILRRRGVYFALMTLALSALLYAIAWCGRIESRSPRTSRSTRPMSADPEITQSHRRIGCK